jgi:hypothetical protein
MRHGPRSAKPARNALSASSLPGKKLGRKEMRYAGHRPRDNACGSVCREGSKQMNHVIHLLKFCWGQNRAFCELVQFCGTRPTS